MKKRKVAALLLVLVISIAMIQGCSKKSDETTTTTTPDTTSTTPNTAEKETPSTDVAKKDVTLTFGTHQSALPTSGIVQELAKDFETETGIKIDFQIVPDAQWRDLLKAKLSSGEAPDIFAADADPLSLFDRVRPDTNCMDLTNEAFTSRMDPSVLPSISYQDKVYGITFPGYKIWVYVYNKQIFSDLNLSIPTNYEELKTISQKIKDSGVTPMWEATQNGWHQVLPLFESGPLYETKYAQLYEKLNKNEMNVKDIKELELIITQLKEFADLGFYGDDYLSNTMESDRQVFAEGKVAMVLEGIGWPGQVAAEYPDMADNMGIFIMPWADNQIVGINPASNAYFGNAKSSNQAEILQFFDFLARPENLQKRLDGDPGSLMLCWPEIESKYPKEYTDYLGTLKNGTVMQVGVSYIDPQWMDVGKDLEAMYTGALTPAQVVDAIVQRRDEQARLQKDPSW